mmetsp:Transcript_159196/g.296774  ORF Transcript_159196/g.296774 Transcript_159196/m.296774 type:complete len:244 (+) Transcript_159196:419-1150(+)
MLDHCAETADTAPEEPRRFFACVPFRRSQRSNVPSPDPHSAKALDQLTAVAPTMHLCPGKLRIRVPASRSSRSRPVSPCPTSARSLVQSTASDAMIPSRKSKTFSHRCVSKLQIAKRPLSAPVSTRPLLLSQAGNIVDPPPLASAKEADGEVAEPARSRGEVVRSVLGGSHSAAIVRMQLRTPSEGASWCPVPVAKSHKYTEPSPPPLTARMEGQCASSARIQSECPSKNLMIFPLVMLTRVS